MELRKAPMSCMVQHTQRDMFAEQEEDIRSITPSSVNLVFFGLEVSNNLLSNSASSLYQWQQWKELQLKVLLYFCCSFQFKIFVVLMWCVQIQALQLLSTSVPTEVNISHPSHWAARGTPLNGESGDMLGMNWFLCVQSQSVIQPDHPALTSRNYMAVESIGVSLALGCAVMQSTSLCKVRSSFCQVS